MPLLAPHDPSEFTLVVDGTTAVVPCVAFALYADGADSEGILDFYRRARAAVDSRFTHYITTSMKRRAKINARADSMVPTWVQNPSELKLYFIEFNGCESAAGVTAADLEMRFLWRLPPTDAIRAQRRSNWRTLHARGAELDLSMTKLRVTLPLDHPLAQDPRALIDWVLGFSLVKRGAFAAGSCGVAINHDEFVSSSLVRSAMEQRIAAVCRRYPGTDWNLPERAVRRLLRWDDAEDDIVHQFPRVSWLTLIGPFGVERFGGGEALRKALAIDPAVHIHSAGSGVVVQAGDMPRFGDPAGRDPLSAYRSAARALRRLRMPFLFGFGVDRGTWVDEWQQSLEAPTT